MPRLPTIRVIGSQAISVRPCASVPTLLGLGMVDVMSSSLSVQLVDGRRDYQVRVAPVVSFDPLWRHLGSLSKDCSVIRRRRFTVFP